MSASTRLAAPVFPEDVLMPSARSRAASYLCQARARRSSYGESSMETIDRAARWAAQDTAYALLGGEYTSTLDAVVNAHALRLLEARGQSARARYLDARGSAS